MLSWITSPTKSFVSGRSLRLATRWIDLGRTAPCSWRTHAHRRVVCSVDAALSSVAAASGVGEPADGLHTATVDLGKLSPMMRHYVETKRQAPGRLLLYRVGDFYEAFFEDARRLADLCDIALTSKEGGRRLAARVPMSGVPHHALQAKLRPLLDAGVSVAIAEQLTPVRPGVPLVERKVTRVLTPGTLADEDFLAPRASTFLAAVHSCGESLTVAIADVSTGHLRAGPVRDLGALRDCLARERPAEVVVAAPPSVHEVVQSSCRVPIRLRVSVGGGAEQLLAEYVSEVDADVRLEDVQPLAADEGVLELDAACVRNMEIVASMRGGDAKRSLCAAVDRAVTSMGARRLRAMLLAPSCSLTTIASRHDVVGTLLDDSLARDRLRALLRPIADIERLAGRVASERASPRDVRSLATSLLQLPRVAAAAEEALRQAEVSPNAHSLVCDVKPPEEVLELAQEAVDALADPAPAVLASEAVLTDAAAALSGNPHIFVSGYDAQLDQLRETAEQPSMWAAQFEQDEQKRSGIAQLRVKHVKRLGFVLRVPRTYAERALDVDPHTFSALGYERVHSTKAELRFRSAQLADLERAHHTALAGVVRRELALFCALRARLGEHTGTVRGAAGALAELDVLAGFAEVAAERAYVRPAMLAAEARTLRLADVRHAVVEQQLGGGRYVPNTLALGGVDAPDLAVVTGPNASGKSCAIRSAGLCVVLAQAGSFVPAQSATLSVCDRVLTRVGAVDDVSDAMSSFQVEMAETASILSAAGPHSLVLLDELGRGTGVVDGIGIACAVAEQLASGPAPPRTLFVTHYHELVQLADAHRNIAACAMQVVAAADGRHVATHRVVPGGAMGSLGIDVARKAGFPDAVVGRAQQVAEALRVPARALGKALVTQLDGDVAEKIHVDDVATDDAFQVGYRLGYSEASTASLRHAVDAKIADVGKMCAVIEAVDDVLHGCENVWQAQKAVDDWIWDLNVEAAVAKRMRNAIHRWMEDAVDSIENESQQVDALRKAVHHVITQVSGDADADQLNRLRAAVGNWISQNAAPSPSLTVVNKSSRLVQ